MTLLGHLALWLAFLVGLWGAVTGFVGGLQGRTDLQQSARHAGVAMVGALVLAPLLRATGARPVARARPAAPQRAPPRLPAVRRRGDVRRRDVLRDGDAVRG